MDGVVVKEIAALARVPKPVQIAGKEYVLEPEADGGWKVLNIPGPAVKVATLQVRTLAGLVDYLAANRDGLNLRDLIVHVVSHECVALLSSCTEDPWRTRDSFLAVHQHQLVGEATPFAFNTFLDNESFIVGLLTMFVDTPARADVLAMVGLITGEKIKTAADDGVSQVVTTRQGVVGAREAKVPIPVMLRPFRTFREIEQPESPFVLRLRRDDEEDAPLSCALFEADAGAWRLTAIANIRDYLKAHLTPDVAILA